MAPVHWIRSNGFLLALAAAVAAAFLQPAPGARGGGLHAELLSHVGIALILFLQGVSLALENVRRGASNWRLHLVIQGFTFGGFPVVGILFHLLVPRVWPGEPEAIRAGFLFLCVLPSTISTSVVFTAVARGNTAGALFNAAVSNLLGVVLTPVLVQLLMHSSGQAAPFGPLLLKILLLTLLPFFIGMGLRPYVQEWLVPHQAWVARISNTVIVFIVYAAFCDSISKKVWEQHGVGTTALVLFWVMLLFAGMSGLVALACRGVRFNRADAIAAYFCSVKKTLAMGVPLALLIFGDRSDVSLILLPLMFYHPLQLLVNGMLANRWAKNPAATG